MTSGQINLRIEKLSRMKNDKKSEVSQKMDFYADLMARSNQINEFYDPANQRPVLKYHFESGSQSPLADRTITQHYFEIAS